MNTLANLCGAVGIFIEYPRRLLWLPLIFDNFVASRTYSSVFDCVVLLLTIALLYLIDCKKHHFRIES